MMKRPQSRVSLQLCRRREKSRGLSAIMRSDKSVPALGGGTQHPGRPPRGERQDAQAGGCAGRQGGGGWPGREALASPGLSGCQPCGRTYNIAPIQSALPPPPAGPSANTRTAPAPGPGSEGTFTPAIIPLGRS